MSQLRILIIDDNQDLADGLAMVLEDKGYLVTIAYNGDDGINAFNSLSFDLVFLDVKLPDINGLELLFNMHKAKHDVSVIMMTGYRVEQLIATVANKADVKILRKPCETERVVDVLNHIKDESIVLIAEDDLDFARGLAEILTDYGVSTLHARTFQEAVDGVIAKSVEVLVLDLQKTVTSALEVYMELKQQNRAVKTIIVTGHVEKDVETDDVLRSAMVTGCLFKPFKPDDMLRIIDQIIER